MAKDLRVGFCKGCYTCWATTPGRCCQDLALRQAGREVVTQGHLDPETEAILARPLVPATGYVAQANRRWDARPEPSSRDTSRPEE